MIVNWTDSTLEHMIDTFMVFDGVAEVVPVDQIFIDFVENNGYQVWYIEDDKGQHDYPIDHPHRFPCVYSSVYHTQEVVDFNYLESVETMNPASRFIR